MQGRQQPRIEWLPPGEDHELIQDALDLVEACGIILDPWQKYVLARSLRRRDGKWAAFEVALVLARQNGKNELLVARELVGLFLLEEELLIHAAHEFATSLEAFRRLAQIVENTDWLLDKVKNGRRGIKRSHGEEGIELVSGQRIAFKTRTKGGGRGFSGDFVAFDEAMIFPEVSLSAIMPVVSAQPDPQIWYTGSAVDQSRNENGVVLARLRERGIAGKDPSLAYFEWSAPFDNPDDVPWDRLDFEERTADGNPALGYRISLEHVTNEYRSMDRRSFAVERWGVGDWPDLDELGSVIPLGSWDPLFEERSLLQDPVCFAFDLSPNRETASIAAAGKRPDGLIHLDLVEQRRGTGWIAARMRELAEKWAPAMIVTDDVGPGGSLVPELEAAGVQVVRVKTNDATEACGLLVDAIDQRRIRHLGRQELRSAIKAADKRNVRDRWLWDRKGSVGDITPLVAVTLAHWAALQDIPSVYEDRGLVSFTL